MTTTNPNPSNTIPTWLIIVMALGFIAFAVCIAMAFFV